MKLYIDTNVYLDYFLKRKKSNQAFKIFKETISCKHKIILSDHVLYELSRFVKPEEVLLFKLIESKMIKIKSTKEDRESTINIASHFSDALHIALAKRAKADVIVTRNIKDFKSFKAKRPEDL